MRQQDSEELHGCLTARAYEARVPLTVSFELTHACNLACLHCFNPSHRAHHEMTTPEVCEILDDLAELGTLYLNLTGGEALARPDLPEILSHARTIGMHVCLLTNATLVDGTVVSRLTAAPPDRIHVSLYGATAAVYDRVTRCPGGFGQFLAGFRLLRGTGIPLRLTSVILRENAHQVEAMRDLSHELGAHFSYCADVIPRQDGNLTPLAHRVTPAAAVDLARRYAPARDQVCPEPAAVSGPFSCTCARASAAITPQGRMSFCVMVPIPQHDVRAGRVREGWETLVRLRDSYDGAHVDCASCELLAHCSRGAQDSLLEAGDLGKCVPYYRELATRTRESA